MMSASGRKQTLDKVANSHLVTAGTPMKMP